MSIYRPDPEFYTKQISEQEKKRKKFTEASYDSSRRGYVVEGKTYTEAQRSAQIKSFNDEIKRIKAEEKKFGKFGPNFGPNVKPDDAGQRFMELLKTARSMKVTDFDSAVESLRAWKEVQDFAQQNPNMVVVQRVDTTEGPMKARIDPFSNPQLQSVLKRGPVAARNTALRQAEVGTVKVEDVYRGTGSAARRVRQKTVVNQEELDRRLEIVDAVVATGVIPQTATTAPTPTTVPAGPAPSTTAAPTTTVPSPTGPTGPTTTTAPPTTTVPSATDRAGLTPDQQAGLRRRGEVTGGMGATRPRPGEPAPTGPAQPTGPARPTGPAQPTTSTGGRTGAGRPGAGTDTRRQRVVNWEPKFREMFPTQAWLLDLDRTKYGDVFRLFQKAITDRMYETPEGLDRFTKQLDGTSFFKELASTGKAREIRGLVGDLGFDSMPFNKFLTTAMNMGWQDETLRQEVYKEAFRKDVTTGQYVNPTAVKRVQASTPYLAIKDIGKQFFSTVDDATVEQRLTGALVDDDIIRQQRELAKTKYAHLSPLLDQGLSLESIASSYRERAARLLEKDINDIDMGSADFSQAFNFGEEGKKRMMSDGEWEILLRSDQRFGWRKTQNAKQEATQLASSIAQAFGRVL